MHRVDGFTLVGSKYGNQGTHATTEDFAFRHLTMYIVHELSKQSFRTMSHFVGLALLCRWS